MATTTVQRRRPSSRGRWVILVGAALFVVGGPCSAPGAAVAVSAPGDDDRSFVGLGLAEALLRLQSEGLSIVFTSELVRPEMTVTSEPRSATAREILDELLEEHGLGVLEGAGDTLVVVARAVPDSDRRLLVGHILSRSSGEPIAAALVRLRNSGLEARSDAAGRFELAGLPDGTYTLEASRDGYVDEELRGVVVAADGGERAVDLRIALRPLPFVNEEIVVRPSRLSLLQEQPVALLALSRREIDALPHIGGEVARALSLFPGTAANDVTARLSIHGGRRDELQIVLDGQEIYDAHHLKDFDSALTIVPAEELAGASLSSGNFAVRNGDRMSGVLDLTTTSPAGPHRVRLGASLFNLLASSSGTFAGGRGSWLGSLRRGTTDLAGRIIDRREPSFWDLMGKLGRQLSDRQSVRGHLLIAGDELAFHEGFGGEAEQLETDSTTRYVWLTHQAMVGSRTLVETTVSSSGSDRDRIGGEVEADQSLAVADERSFDVLGLAQDWTREAGTRHHLEGGLELRRYSAAYDYRNEIERDSTLVGDVLEPSGSIPRFTDRLEGKHYAGWLSDRIALRSDLTLELGLRFDRLTLTDDRLVSPRLNLAWQLGKSGVVRAGWGFFHQSQRPYEIMVEDGETGLYPAERSEHRVLGYERLLRTSTKVKVEALRIELYSRDISTPRPRHENLFETLGFFPEMEEDRVRITPERARADGVELLLRGVAGTRLDWWMSYAFSRADDRIDGRQVPRSVDQPHALNLAFDWRVSHSWSVNVTWRYHTGWPTTPVSLVEEEDEDGETLLLRQLGDVNSDRLPSYHRMDLRASRSWSVGRGRIRFYVDVHNVFDRKNVAGFDTEIDEERSELIVVEDFWVGVLPSAGISWEF